MAPRKPSDPQRPPLPRVPEEVRRWSALLKAEVDTWPDITYRRMFGATAVYRGGVIFAGLPGTRSLFTGRSVIFKLPRRTATLDKRLQGDSRVHAGTRPGKGWFGFELSSPRDLVPALEWIGRAYEAAASDRGKG
jgi:hypothetical protein